MKFLLISISAKDGYVNLKFINKFRYETRVLLNKDITFIIKKGHIARTLFGDILVVKIKDEDLGKMVLSSSGWTTSSIKKINDNLGITSSKC